MTVKVLPRNLPQVSEGQDYVRVSTCNDPLDDTVTLATIERVVQKRQLLGSARPEYVKILVTRQRMTAKDAVDLATSYAERKNIEVVVTDH